MTILKKGTPTDFQDKSGVAIKIGDRIKSVQDGTILTIDKFGKGVSALGFKYDLPNLGPVSRGMNEDGTYFARLSAWSLTDEEPVKPQGEILTADDVAELAPPSVKDPRNTSKYRDKDVSVDDVDYEGIHDNIVNLAALEDYQDEDLTEELRRRGYHGEITKTKTIKI